VASKRIGKVIRESSEQRGKQEARQGKQIGRGSREVSEQRGKVSRDASEH
jgi:hypothetical protein